MDLKIILSAFVNILEQLSNEERQHLIEQINKKYKEVEDEKNIVKDQQ